MESLARSAVDWRHEPDPDPHRPRRPRLGRLRRRAVRLLHPRHARAGRLAARRRRRDHAADQQGGAAVAARRRHGRHAGAVPGRRRRRRCSGCAADGGLGSGLSCSAACSTSRRSRSPRSTTSRTTTRSPRSRPTARTPPRPGATTPDPGSCGTTSARPAPWPAPPPWSSDCWPGRPDRRPATRENERRARPRRAGQVRRHPDRGRGRPGDRRRLGPAGARRRARPRADGRRRTRASSTCSTRRSAASCAAVTVRGPHGEPVPAPCCSTAARAWVESAQACGLALTGGERAESATTWGVGELVMQRDRSRGHRHRGRPRRLRDQRRGSGPARRPRRDGRPAARRRARPGWRASREVDLGPARARLAGVAPDLRQRRRQPADRPVRRDQDLRPAEGHRRGAAPGRRRRPRGARGRHRPSYLPGEGRGRRRRARLRPAAARRRAPAGLRRRRRGRRPGRRAPGPPTSWSPARAPSTSPAAPARCRTASRTVAAEALRPCVALAGQVLVGSREMRALGIESAYSLVDLVGEERALGDPGRQRWPSWPRGSPAPGRAEPSTARSQIARNNPACATIGPVVRASRTTEGAARMTEQVTPKSAAPTRST